MKLQGLGRKYFVKILSALAAGTLLSACGAADESLAASDELGPDDAATEQAPASPEVTGEVSQALDAAIAEGPFKWDSSKGPIALRAISTHYCVLTSVHGNFRGAGEQAKVFQQDRVWRLGVIGAQSISASAFCFRRSAFRGEGSNHIAFSTPESTQVDSAPTVESWRDRGFATALFHGDAASMISGISGKFNGDGEAVTIFQVANPLENNELAVSSEITVNAGKTRGYGASFFVGVPNLEHVARFIGPGGQGNADEAGEFEASPGQHKWMAATNEAMCYFTTLSGTLQGLGNGAEIVTGVHKGVERWRLNSDLAMARARCFKLDQR